MTSDTSGEVLSYGYDLLGGLRKDLKTLQGFRTVVQELLQNAEDAQNLQGSHATKFWLDFRSDGLWVGNDGEFTDDNFAAISSIGAGSKRYDEDTIGSFGVGFVSVYQITDRPEVYSRGERRTLSPTDGKTYRDQNVAHPWPSTFRLPWAATPSEVRTRLEAAPVSRDALRGFVEDARSAFVECGVFLRYLTTLTLLWEEQPVFTLEIERPDSRTIQLTGSDGVTTTFRRLAISLPAELKSEAQRRGRKTDLTLAYPVRPAPDFRGRLYAYLPTREESFLPLHINADFYPNTDRKSLLWDEADKRVWNEQLLTHAAAGMRTVLEDLKAVGGAEAVYDFTAGVERGARQLRGGPSPLAAFTEGAWNACVQAYRDAELYEGRDGKWVSHSEFLTVRYPHDPVLTDVIARKIGWVLPPSQHTGYAPLFGKLKADELNVEVFFAALKKLFATRPDWLHREERPETEVLAAFLGYLDTLRTRERAQFDQSLPQLDALHLALNVNRHPRPVQGVRTCPPDFLTAVERWLGNMDRVADDWLEAAPEWLRGHVPAYRPEDLCDALSKETPESIEAQVREGWDVTRAYAFLESGSALGSRALGAAPIYRTQRGAFAFGKNLVLPRSVHDPFGVREVLDTGSLQRFPSLLEHLNLDVLDAGTYYGRLLPDHFDAHPEMRRKIIDHLGKHYQAVDLTAWKVRACVECRDGTFRQPEACYFPNDLMDRLFGRDYPAYAQDKYNSPGVPGLMLALGVRTTAGDADILAQLKGRQQEPVTDAAVELRARILDHALTHSDKSLALALSSVAWLPNEQRSQWKQPSQLHTLNHKGLIGTESGVEYCALPVPKNARQDNVTALKFATPTFSQVAAHIRVLNASGGGPAIATLNWLEGKATTLTDADVGVLRTLKLFSYIDQAKKKLYEVPGAFFLKDPGLGRWRHTIPAGAFKQLVKRLGLRDTPGTDTYVSVLLEIAAAYPDGRTPSTDDFRVAERCFHSLSRAYAAMNGGEKASLMVALRGKRLVPVTGPAADRGALTHAQNALYRDMPRAWHEQFNFPSEHHVYLREGHTDKAFLASLGVAALSENHLVQYQPRAETGLRPLPNLDAKLARYSTVLLRFLFKELGAPALKEKQDLLEAMHFFQTGPIEATVVARGAGFHLSSSCVLESAFDPRTTQLLVADASAELGSAALAEAFGLPIGTALTTLFSIWSSATPEAANRLLDVGKFPDLPAAFEPQHVPGAVATNESLQPPEDPSPDVADSSPDQTSDPRTPSPAPHAQAGTSSPRQGGPSGDDGLSSPSNPAPQTALKTTPGFSPLTPDVHHALDPSEGQRAGSGTLGGPSTQPMAPSEESGHPAPDTGSTMPVPPVESDRTASSMPGNAPHRAGDAPFATGREPASPRTGADPTQQRPTGGAGTSPPSGPSPFAGEPPATQRDGHRATPSRTPWTPGGSSPAAGRGRAPQKQFKNYVYAYQASREDIAAETHAQKVDRRGMDYAMSYERHHNRTPEDCSADTGAGYDIFSTAEDRTVRHIELKTVSGPWGERGVTLSRNQLAAAQKYGERYWLYIIENLDDRPVLHAIQHPEGQTSYYVFNDGWRGNASEEYDFTL